MNKDDNLLKSYLIYNLLYNMMLLTFLIVGNIILKNFVLVLCFYFLALVNQIRIEPNSEKKDK